MKHPDAAPATPATYEQAGVSIDRGNALVERIKPLARSTQRSGVMSSIGGFGALFDLKNAGYKDPVLVSTTDGVGTKLRVAQHAGQHRTIGIDLVAMCVNDLIVQGAEPLFFLDYFATGALRVDQAEQVISGIAEGCLQAGCALIGGETAEMPGMYQAEDYDLAGFAVGAVERGSILPLPGIQAGDTVIGLASSGVHSNGYSLVRHLVARSGLDYGNPAPFAPSQSLAEALLTPTRIYVKSVLAALRAHEGDIKALAHITGGGLLENIPRVLPRECGVALRRGAWPSLPVFEWLQRTGAIADSEMLRTFNCGIGMVMIVPAEAASAIVRTLNDHGETACTIGAVTARGGDAVTVA